MASPNHLGSFLKNMHDVQWPSIMFDELAKIIIYAQSLHCIATCLSLLNDSSYLHKQQHIFGQKIALAWNPRQYKDAPIERYAKLKATHIVIELP